MPFDPAQAAGHFTRRHDEIRGWRHELHRHPEIAFKEHWTSAFVAERLAGFGYQVTRGVGGTGVVATRPGPGTAAIGLRADMDALPMQERNVFGHASMNAGCMHACGHDGHTTMLLAAAQFLAAEGVELPGTVHFIFQPAEEGEAGAAAMIRDGLFERFPMDAVYGLHNWPGLEQGTIASRVGAQMAAVDRFEIFLRGQGAHGAMPHQGQDTLLAASALVLQLQGIVARNVNPLDTAVVSVTQIHGGEAYNVLPAEVVLRGGTRHFTEAVQAIVERRLRETCAGVAATHGLEAEVNYRRGYPATVNSAAETAIALEAAARTVGEDRAFADRPPSMASEDFSFMLREKPGCYAWIGAGDSSGGRTLHSPVYDFNDKLLPVGAAYWVNLAHEALASLAAR